MTRCLFVGISLLALGACGTKPASDPDPGSGSGARERAPDPQLGGDPSPTRGLVRDAFGGKVPAFPQLSRDGATAIVELDTPVGLSGVSTYSVAYLVTANAVPALVPIIDSRLVHLLLEADERPTLDRETLATTARGISKRLADEGFTAWQGSVELAPEGRVTAGPYSVTTARRNRGVTIEVTGNDATLASDTIEPIEMGQISGSECASAPVPRKAWFDSARRRVLVQIGWNAGADGCESPDDQYRFWAIP